jgi:hypothetical protein
MNYQEMVFLIRKRLLGTASPLFFLGLGKRRREFGEPYEYSEDDFAGLSRKLIFNTHFPTSWT